MLAARPVRFGLALLAGMCAMPAAAESPLAIDTIAGVYKHRFANGDVEGNHYSSEDVLEIVKRTPKLAYVRLHSEFFNGHTCDISGIAELRGDLLMYDKHRNVEGKICHLTLEAHGGKILFGDKDSACRIDFCGARGSLDGTAFPLTLRRPIRYMKRLLASRELADAVSEYSTAHPH